MENRRNSVRWPFFEERAVRPIFLPWVWGIRQNMQGWFSQIVVGIIVTVVGTVIANAIVGGRGGHNFMPGIHFPGRAGVDVEVAPS